MRVSNYLLPSFAVVGLSSALTVNQTLSISNVTSLVSDFLSGVKNGTIAARDTNQASSAIRLPTGCTLACSFLDFALPGTVSYPGSKIYNLEETYWSQQQALTLPACRYSPTSALEVSLAVLVVQVAQCQFAVKSGGHAAFAGASNINQGLTIDLTNLNQITVSSDHTQTSIGPGNNWYDVYSELVPKGLAVIGGRVSAIGVGGLTLGGGISFFSGRYGWACDNVNTYELVTADGLIREVTYQSNPDLFFALRGGGNNFGIVTRFDLATFQQGNMWGGSTVYFYDPTTAAALNNAFYWMNINSQTDPYGQSILAYAYVPQFQAYAIASDLQYGKPVANPPIFKNFTAVQGAIETTMRITNLTDLVQELNSSNPGGNRQTYWALTVKNSPTLMADIFEIFMEETNAIVNVTGIGPSCAFQPIGVDMTSHFSKNGGNALGVSASDGPLNVVNIVYSWTSPSDDARVLAAARNTVNRSNATAYAQGLGHPFLYQNYAALEQPVFPSYGKTNLARLQKISKTYDPAGVWQKLQPGYFKLF